MKKPYSISQQEARRYALDRQGLWQKKKTSALATIEKLGYVQIDTLAVVTRAHHHVLLSRNDQYRENMIGNLLKKKKIFEYWSHAASYLPMRDFRFSLVKKKEYLDGKAHWFPKDKKMIGYILDRIGAEGPLQSRDFEAPNHKSGSWYNWKPAKRALEQLFLDGRLMVSERVNFQKVYDLAERVIPAGTNTNMPTKDEFAEYLIESALRAHGFASVREICYLRRGTDVHVKRVIKRLLEENRIVPLMVEGSHETYYAEPSLLRKKITDEEPRVTLLSPFDNLLIQRKRTEKIFGYDYQIECYLPEQKRKFGYFCLPVLYGDRFIGRLDPKADRASGKFIVKSFHIEHPLKKTEQKAFKNALKKSLDEFAAFHGCTI